MSEGEPIARTPSFQCPDCRVVMEPIRLLDATEPGWNGDGSSQMNFQYAAANAEASWGRIPILGRVEGRICPECGRIQLYGAVAPRRQPPPPEIYVPTIDPRPRPRRVEPLNLDTRLFADNPRDNDAPPIDPPQPITSAPQWDSVAPSDSLEIETAEAVVLEWYVETLGQADSRVGFETEQTAEAHARERVRRDETARVVVTGPRGRRYRVLP